MRTRVLLGFGLARSCDRVALRTEALRGKLRRVERSAVHTARSSRDRGRSARDDGDMADAPQRAPRRLRARDVRPYADDVEDARHSCGERCGRSTRWAGLCAARSPSRLRARRSAPSACLIYRPAAAQGPVPVFLSLNFQGNHAINADPGIELSTSWFPSDDQGVVDQGHRAARGADRSRWPLEAILSKGYALATAYYGDFDPDYVGGFEHGVQTLFYRPGQQGPGPDEWGAIGGWAWGSAGSSTDIATDRRSMPATWPCWDTRGLAKPRCGPPLRTNGSLLSIERVRLRWRRAQQADLR